MPHKANMHHWITKYANQLYIYRQSSAENRDLVKTEDYQDRCRNGKPRNYSPICNGSRSPLLDTAHRVLPIPFRLVIEAACAIIGHKEHRKRQIPRRNYITPMPTIDASTIY
jgi:hypothetical protein